MLDILRKHASSWVIKLILGAITVSFVFFFGYSSMRKGARIGRYGSVEAVATVNGMPISAADYRFTFDHNLERLRASFQGKEMPEFVRKMAESLTLQQLVTRELALSQADALGLTIPDEELADVIRKSPATQHGGEFDPLYYKHEFLPYFKQRFGLDYEWAVRADLKDQAFEDLFRSIDANLPSPAGAEGTAGEDAWTFEVVALAPAAMIEAKAIKARDEATSLAKMLAAADPKTWKGLLAPFKIQPGKVGPLKIKDRAQLLEGQATFDDFSKIFALTDERPVLADPIEHGDKIFVLRLVSRTSGARDAVAAWPAGDFYRSWMAKLADKAKVVSFLKERQ
jgi:SurA-like N-terminal domain